MKNHSIIRIIATLILIVVFSESVMANVIVNNVETFTENIAELSDGEHTEEAVETTTSYVNSVADGVITPSAVDTVEKTEISTLTELNSIAVVDDTVISDSAIDFEVDTEGVPDYALELAESNSRYSELDKSSKFYLNRYIGVREDTMTECEHNGLTIRESIPMALLMQRLKFDYSSAVDMVINYGSQTAALDSAMEYREKEFEIGFLSQDNIKPELVDLLKVGYSTDELIESFAVSRCIGMPVREIITKDENKIIDSFENTVISLTPVFNPFGTGLMSINKQEQIAEQEDIINTDVIEIGNKHYVKSECISGYMESNNLTAEEMEIEILAKKVELDIVDESEIDTVLNGIQAYSETTGEVVNDIRGSSDYKEGPFNFKNGMSENVDLIDGTLSLTNNILSTPGINGLDLNINLIYFSTGSTGKEGDNRINITNNWQFSFPYLLSKSGGRVLADKKDNDIKCVEKPMFVVLSDGTKYPIDLGSNNSEDNRWVTHCQTDNMYFSRDCNSKGGTDSCFELTHMDGTIDYFNMYGRWIATVNRFGNSIRVTEYSENTTNNSKCIKITDTLGKIVSLTTIKTSKGYEQRIVRPDNNTIKYIYENISITGTTKTRLVLKEKREMVDSVNTLSTKFEYIYSNGSSETDMGDSASNMLLSKVTYPTGMTSNYTYIWNKLYRVEPILFRRSDGYYMQVKWRVEGKSQPRLSKKWLTVDGVDKNVEEYDYIERSYNYYDGNRILPPEDSDIEEIYIGKDKDGVNYETNLAIATNTAFSGQGNDVTTVYYLSGVNGSSKNHINYFFDSNNKIESIEYSDKNGVYSKVTNYYDTDKLHQLYPKSRVTVEGDSEKKEYFNYSTGEYLEHITCDKNGNRIAYERTDYDYGSLADEHYSLPLKIESHMSSNQQVITENTLSSDRKTISESNTYLQTGSNKVKKGWTKYSYSGDPGRVTEKREYVSNNQFTETTYTYDVDVALPRSQVFSDGFTSYKTRYDYTGLGLVKKVIDPMSFTTIYTYDKIGNITRESFSGSAISTDKIYEYDYEANTMTFTNENGKRLKYNYDQAGNLTSVVDLENNNNVLESYGYDVYMRPATQVSGNATTAITYDNRDRITRKTVNGGSKKLAQEDYAYTINNTGVLLTTTVQGDANACSYTTSVQQDVLGRTVFETNRQGGKTEYTYDMMGNAIKVVPPQKNGGYSITYTYDHAGNVLSETETAQNIDTVTKNYTYDMLGRLTSFTDGKGNKTNYTYWGGMDWIKEIDAPFSGTDRTFTQYEYDKAGNLKKETVKCSTPGDSDKTRYTKYTYDDLNRVTESEINGVSTTYEYDKVGNMTKQTMANSKQSVTYQYDQLNRPTKYTDALGKSEIYTYNNYGDMVKKVDRNGITTNYTYDALHRLTQEKATKNNVTTTNSYVYALTGQLVSESNGSASKSYRYYINGVGISEEENISIDGTDYKLRRIYNSMDKLIGEDVYENGTTKIMSNAYSYDEKGRYYLCMFQSISDFECNTDYCVYYTYDKNDNITSAVVRESGYTNKFKLKTTYNYNDANLLTSMFNDNSSKRLSMYYYDYNFDGNINRKSETGKVTEYTYDGAGRLSGEKFAKSGQVTNMAYTYDEAGNRNSLTVTGTENYVTKYSYDKNNRLLKTSKRNSGADYIDVTDYTYDNNGNQIRTDSSRQGLTPKFEIGLYAPDEDSGYGYEMFTYNGLNQLVKYEDEMSNKAEYAYMANGLRLSKTVNGDKTSFLWNGNQIALTIESDETRSYSRAPGYMRIGTSKDSTVAYNKRSRDMYLFNGHGDVVGITDCDGNVKKTYEYDAFGNEVNPSDDDTNPFRYCGEYYDDETGSIYLRARYYNPSTGRFTAEDPIKDGLNWYAYCGDNPVVFADPSGLKDVPLRETIEGLGGSVTWYSKNNVAKIELDGQMVYAYNNDSNGNYFKIDEDGQKVMYSDDEWLFKSLAVTVDLGKGWKGRIERNSSGSNYGKKHIHIYNGKESYSQNEDGSPHDGSKGSPPKNVKKKLKELKSWDWDANEDKWINKIDISLDESGVYNITYPNGRKVEFYYVLPAGGTLAPSREALIKYYTGPTKININPWNNWGAVYTPTPSPGSVALPAPNAIPVLP